MRVAPEALEAEALRMLRAVPRRPLRERLFAISLLGGILDRDRMDLLEFLLQLARDGSEPDESEAALSAGFDSDSTGPFRDLCLSRCTGESGIPFSLLSRRCDPAVKSRMTELSSFPTDALLPQGSIPHLARRTLGRIEILEAPDAGARLLSRLEGKDGDIGEACWTLEMILQHRPVGAAECLRARLDAGLEQARKSWAEGGDESPRPPFEETFLYSMDLEALSRDVLIDSLLVGLHDLGAPLSEVERARLRHFGYGGDPAQRLRELLAESD
jgi:hypothetical protein